MDSEDWCGLAVRTRDGTMLGAVVGVFAQGPLAGRLRVQGEYRRWTSWTGVAVYAIPRHALVRGKQQSLVLNATPTHATGNNRELTVWCQKDAGIVGLAFTLGPILYIVTISIRPSPDMYRWSWK